MGKIIKLDDALSNKIAAGEVVERPASIVKELVENAIDANSTKIVIDIEEGGLSKIQVTDNGDGIEPDDVETAFYRHATSKIKTDKDLFQIQTLGFRGEALPSIASVSYLTLNSSIGTEAGVELKLEGGKIVSKSSSRSRKGTEVTITNLFYNTPARLKHLKTVSTELGNISDVVNRLALAHPDVSFRLLHQGKDLLHTSGNGNQQQVIAAIYGRAVAQKMLSIEGETIDFSISGFVAKPEITRAGRQYLSLFINGRYIRNYTLARAIQEGYHTLLPIGRYPIVVLNIKMDPLLIDVNVHPSKLEVRISKEEDLYELIRSTIKGVFNEVQLIPSYEKPKVKKEKSEQIKFDLSTFHEQKKEDIVVKEEKVIEQPSVVEMPKVEAELPLELTSSIEIEPELEKPSLINKRVPTLYPIGQMHGTYILAQNEEGLYLIDQHAAQERIKYEYFRDKVGEVATDLQELLIPFTFEFTHAECTTLDENKEALNQVGIYLESFGPQTFIVRAHPTWFPKGYEEETMKEIIEQVLTQKKVDIKKLREEAAILMSCKAAIKANRYLRQDEIFALLETLRKCADPFTCPHGRPIFVHFSTYEMERMFKRQ